MKAGRPRKEIPAPRLDCARCRNAITVLVGTPLSCALNHASAATCGAFHDASTNRHFHRIEMFNPN